MGQGSTPATRRNTAEQQRVDAALVEIFEHRIRFNETLGLKVVSADAARPTLRFEMRDALVGHYA